MTQEQRLADLIAVIRAEFNKYQDGSKSVEFADRLSDGGLGTTVSDISAARDTAIATAVTALVDNAPTNANTLNKLYNLIQAFSGGGYATMTDVNNAIQAVIGAAPAALDTLQELAAALNNDANAVSALTTQIAAKADSTDVYTKTEADAKFLTQQAFADAIGNPDVDLVVLFNTGLL